MKTSLDQCVLGDSSLATASKQTGSSAHRCKMKSQAWRGGIQSKIYPARGVTLFFDGEEENEELPSVAEGNNFNVFAETNGEHLKLSQQQ